MQQHINKLINNNKALPSEVPIQHEFGKYKQPKLMKPQQLTHELHSSSTIIESYVNGCPVDCGTPWTRDHIIAALKRGAHPSAKQPDARQCLIKETMSKVNEGYAKLVKWKDIKNNLPKQFKLSPVAMIPHKSRAYRCILDLSFQLKYKGQLMPSVNSSTIKLAPQKAMSQLGSCINRTIHTMATNYDPSNPFFFSKLDIKDGYWRMLVSEEDAWNFCYVLPPESKESPLGKYQIVIPASLQMGWCESPPFFCAATETACDIIHYLHTTTSTLPTHQLEHHLLPSQHYQPS